MIIDLTFYLIILAILVFVARRRLRTLTQRIVKVEADIAAIRGDIDALARGQAGPAGLPAAAPQLATQVEQVAAAPRAPSQPASVPPVWAAHDVQPPPPAGPSLEERLGAHWAVLVGGLALALGGIFLVRYSIEAGLLGPGVRVILGGILALILIGLGEKTRRGEILHRIPQLPVAHIPSVLTAAGTAVAFGTIYAAHALYGFIGPAVAFLLLGAVALATMWSAILHGPALAGFGLAGSYVTPLLLSSDAPSPWPVMVYLLAVTIAAYLLARLRHWLWLAATAVAGAVLWGLMFVFQADRLQEPWITAAMLYAGLQTVLAIGCMAIEPHIGMRDEDAEPDWIGTGALAVLTWLAVLVLSTAPFTHVLWLPFAFIVTALLATAGLVSAPVAAASVLAGIVGLAVVGSWPGLAAPPTSTMLATEMARVLRLPENVQQFLMFSILAVAPAGFAAERRLRRGADLPLPTAALYAVAATVPVLLALILAYLRVTQFDSSITFGLAALVLAAFMASSADYFEKAEATARAAGAEPRPALNLAAGALAAAAIAAFSFALVTTLSRGYLTVALALSALGTAHVATRKSIPLLRYAVTALGAVVLARLAWDPRIMGTGVGTTPLFNWLLLGYGVPALAFALSANLLRRQGDDAAVRIADGLAVLFTGLFAFFQLHHAMAGGDLTKPITGHVEQGLLATLGLGFTHVLTRLDLARGNVIFRTASHLFAGLSLLMIVVGLGFIDNPLFSRDVIGGAVIFSSLIPAYLLPGFAGLYVARAARGVRPDWFVRIAGSIAIALIFAYVTLEVRHIHQGSRIYVFLPSSSAEIWGYTAAWLALAVAFLAYGLWRQSLEARIASALLIVVVLAKVLLIDLAGVSGLWRALSFLCLGAVLVGIGRVYQRLIMARVESPVPGGGDLGRPRAGA